MNRYDDPDFLAAYAQLSRSRFGLEGAGEWHQLELMFPELSGKAVLDLSCGYGWQGKYAADHDAVQLLGIDQSARMIGDAIKKRSVRSVNRQIKTPDILRQGF